MKNKLSNFPGFSITSVLFILTFATSFFMLFRSYAFYSNFLSTISCLLVPAPYIVMAIFTMKSKERPGLGFSIACLVNTIFVIYLYMGVLRIWDPYYIFGDLWLKLCAVLDWFSFLLNLTGSALFGVLGILSKFVKNMDKLFKLWFIFPLPFAAAFLSDSLANLIRFIRAIVYSSLEFGGFIYYIICFFAGLVFVAAFFAVAYRLKNADENTEVTVNYYSAQ